MDQYIDGPMDPKIGGLVPPVPMLVAPIYVFTSVDLGNFEKYEIFKNIMSWNTLKVFQINGFKILRMYFKYSQKYSNKRYLRNKINQRQYGQYESSVCPMKYYIQAYI